MKKYNVYKNISLLTFLGYVHETSKFFIENPTKCLGRAMIRPLYVQGRKHSRSNANDS